MKIREAKRADAEMVAEVVCRSIQELCFDDHKGDSDILERWLQNKTTKSVSGWISAPDNYCVTATDDSGDVIGFGMLHREGELKLLYVSPDCIGTGAGREILHSIERCAASLGLETVLLDSTNSAIKFYEHQGYRHRGSCDPRSDGLSCNGMVKHLAT